MGIVGNIRDCGCDDEMSCPECNPDEFDIPDEELYYFTGHWP